MPLAEANGGSEGRPASSTGLIAAGSRNARSIACHCSGSSRMSRPAAAGRDILDEPEQWQAILRALREPAAMRPVLEAGRPSDPPFASASGIESASWSYRGRRYALLVNVTDGPARLDEEALAPWRSLFEARSDPRHVLPPCGAGRCLLPGTALWLESRPR